jgi:hypothetical protein
MRFPGIILGLLHQGSRGTIRLSAVFPQDRIRIAGGRSGRPVRTPEVKSAAIVIEQQRYYRANVQGSSA